MKALKIGYRFVLLLVLLSVCAILLSCGGDTAAGVAPDPVVAVTIAPTSASMVVSTTQSFTATVTGSSNTAVTWSANLGTIAGTGSTITYTAPSTTSNLQFPVLTATSVADPTKSATVSITVTAGATVSVSVAPSNAILGPNTTTVFTATTLNSSNTAVTWTASGGTLSAAPGGSPANSTQYTAPATTGSYTVTATSVADPTKSSTVTVTVVSLTISPTTSTVLTQGQQTFSVSVSGSSSISIAFSASAGTIVGSGTSATYTAPVAPGVYTVTASVVGNSLITAVATVNVSQLSISPASVMFLTSGTRTQLFNTIVSGGLSSQVTFAASAGTLVPAGTSATYTAPNVPGTYTVTATSVSNPLISATATVTVILPSLTLFEVDGVIQTNRPVTVGRAFPQGDILTCPQPVVGGVAIANYQADVKNRWPDNSVKFAIVSFTQTLAPAVPTVVTFQNAASCNNTGFLTAATMATFNSGSWGAQTVVAPAGVGVPVTVDAKIMLAASDPGGNTFGDCKNDYWLQGPVVTAVIVQDCTSASAFDFGWTWNGTTMSSPVTGNAPRASFHPMFILYFYPGSNAVQVDHVLELPWTGRMQDQLADITFKAGSTPSTVWSHVGARRLADVSVTNNSTSITSASAAFTSTDVGLPIDINDNWSTIASVTNSTTAVLASAYPSTTATNQTAYINLQINASRHRKTFWSNADGSATAAGPGHIRIDHNFPYLKFTKAVPNYDPGVSVSPDSTCTSCTPYAKWATSDKGEIGGNGGISGFSQDYSANTEGAPLQREELAYLYNMSTCGVANGACAKAWQVLTATSGTIDGALSTGNVVGGAGMWNNFGNVPFHFRESRIVADGLQTSTNRFHCAGFDDPNVGGNSTNCNGSGTTNVATGKPLSRHAHSADQWGFGNIFGGNIGTTSLGGWASLGCDHWMDYSYVPYLLTGDYYYLENHYQSASYCLEHVNPSQGPAYSNGFFGYVNSDSVLRDLAWSLQTVGRAASIAPDFTPEASYYKSMLNSNLGVLEGILGVTGTALTPTTTNASCSSYNFASANRWDWGHCTVISQCLTGACTPIPVQLHAVAVGVCPIDPSVLDATKTSSTYAPWHYHFLSIALSELRELGYTQAAGASSEMQKQLEEKVGDSTFNPYLIATYIEPVKSGNSSNSCSTNLSDPFISSYASAKAAFVAGAQSATTFDHLAATQNFPCADHGYSLIARAAGSFLQDFGTLSTDANCAGGTCGAAATWNWLQAEVPYFNNAPAHSNSCGASDEQIKFALTPR